MAISSITSSGLSPAIQRRIQNAAQNGGTINIGERLVSQGVSIANSNNSSPLLNLLNLLPQILLASILGLNNTSNTASVDKTENTTQPTTENIQSIKQEVNSELNQLKNLGVKVSDWDNNNTCTLSYQDKTGTVTIANNGQISFDGDIENIMELLKQSPQGKKSVANQNKFLAKMENSGDPIIGAVKTTTVKVNGKEISVNKYTGQSGKKYYLDNSGKEITPDTTA